MGEVRQLNNLLIILRAGVIERAFCSKGAILREEDYKIATNAGW
jgi:hypothetical protein